MLVVKVTEDKDVFNKSFIRVGVKPDFAANHMDLLRNLNFVYDKTNKQFVQAFKTKSEVNKVVKFITSHYKYYTVEYAKVLKRKSSDAVIKTINKL